MKNKSLITLSPAFKTGLRLVEALQMAQKEAYFVGGAFRAYLSGKPLTGDVDIATSAKPSEIKQIVRGIGMTFERKGELFGSFPVHNKDGTVEVTSFRTEGRYSDARHPDSVQFVDDYRLDAARRDFTINAVYLDPLNGRIKDLFNGVADLKAGIIRLIGSPKRKIDEDHLRMIRAVRLAAQLGFRLERNTYASIKTRSKLIQTVAGSRIRPELEKILLADNAANGISLLDEIGLLRFLLPEVSALKNVRHKFKTHHLEGDAFQHSILVLKNIKEKKLETRLAALLHDTGKATTGKRSETDKGGVIKFIGHDEESVKLSGLVAKRLALPKKQASQTAWLIRNNRHWPHFATLRFSKKILLIKHPLFPQLINLWEADALANINMYEDGSIGPYRTNVPWLAKKLLKSYYEKKSLIKKFCRGERIIKTVKLIPGTEIGRIIDQITEAVMKNKITTEKELEHYLKKCYKKT